MSTNPLPQPQRRKGFTPFPNDVMQDWPRLVSGDAQVFSVMVIVSETVGAVRERGTAPPYWSRPISNDELAGFCRCTVRAIEMALKDLLARKVLLRKRASGGYAYHVPFETWPDLPDRPPKVVSISGDDVEDQLDDDGPADSLKGKVMPVFEKPQRVRGGARPRAKELPAAASKLRLTSNEEIEYTAHMCDGQLNIELNITAAEQIKSEAKRNGFRSDGGKSQITKHGDAGDAARFGEFQQACNVAGLSGSRADIHAAAKQWQLLTPAEQGAAVKGVLDRHKAGEYDNPTYRPLPQNFLARRHWERAVRKPLARAGDDDAFRRKAVGLMERVRARDDAERGRK